jgi:hypothetical protein
MYSVHYAVLIYIQSDLQENVPKDKKKEKKKEKQPLSIPQNRLS